MISLKIIIALEFTKVADFPNSRDPPTISFPLAFSNDDGHRRGSHFPRIQLLSKLWQSESTQQVPASSKTNLNINLFH